MHRVAPAILAAVLIAAPGLLAAGEPPARTSLGGAASSWSAPDKSYVVLRRAPLEAVIADNRAVDDAILPGHRSGYHGVAALRHHRQPRNLFVPAYSGLNFEHIHDGTVQPREVLFEPRNAPMELRVINEHTAELYQPPTPHWKLESCMRYELLGDGSIELTFECIPRAPTFTNGYIGLFWASYIDRPESPDIHFIGCPAEDPKATPAWVRGSTPAHGELPTHPGLSDNRMFAHAEDFPLTLVFNLSRHRHALPWYFGVCRNMAFLQMFGPGDSVRITQSPSGGGIGCPAWDFQWFVDKPRVGQRYQLVMRAAYVPVTGPGESQEVRAQLQQIAARWKAP